MNSHEFTLLMRRIKTVKAGIGVWLKKIDKERNADDPTQADTLAHWATILANTNADDAMRAVEDIAEGRLSLGRDWSQLPYVIRDAASGGGSTSDWKEPVWDEARREWTVHCLLCDDVGMVTVCRVETQCLMRDNPDGMTPKKFHTCAVACTCGNGDIRARGKKAPPQYNERTKCRITAGMITIEDKIEVLRQWVDKWRGCRPVEARPNYTPEFDAFNEERDR